MTTEGDPTSLHQPYHIALCEGVERDFLSSKQSWRQPNLFCQSWGTVPNNGKLNWTAQRQCFDKRKSILTWRGTKTWSMQAPFPEQDYFIALRSVLAPATATNVRNLTVLSWRLIINKIVSTFISFFQKMTSDQNIKTPNSTSDFFAQTCFRPL